MLHNLQQFSKTFCFVVDNLGLVCYTGPVSCRNGNKKKVFNLDIADFLGVSVFELYGVPSQQQIILERQQKIVDRAKEMKQCNIEGATTEELLKRNEDLQAIIDSFETERQNILNALIVAHNAQVKVNILAQAENEHALHKESQPDPAITRRAQVFLAASTHYHRSPAELGNAAVQPAP